jgi:hypothetical protein
VLEGILARVRLFQREAHVVLSVHETAPSRVVILEETYRYLGGLSLSQDELIRQALRCVENQLYRAAHVMVWAGFMDFLEEKLASDGLKKLRAARPKWTIKSMEDLREYVSEHQLIEAARDIDLCRKNEMKALLGLLNKRNECAHPSDFYPGLNDSLGYISEILQRIETLRPRTVRDRLRLFIRNDKVYQEGAANAKTIPVLDRR